jgi:hypothetical protein
LDEKYTLIKEEHIVMKYGVRDICDVVLRAKARMQVGNKLFYKDEPVIYFDTLTTSSLEGAATTVYANGGRGNTRLMSWDGERTVTFNMTDALISPESFMILSGAGLMEATNEEPIYQHITERVDRSACTLGDKSLEIPLSRKPYVRFDKYGEDGAPATGANPLNNSIYVMLMKNGEIVSEPYIPVHENQDVNGDGKYILHLDQEHVCYDEGHTGDDKYFTDDIQLSRFDAVLVDYYVEHKAGAKQITITADSFGGNFYLEASTLFRNEDGVDMPAEFIIPNCRIQGNFTFTMSASGDPSTFDFVLDAFPDYTRWDKSKKVLAALQVFETGDGSGTIDKHRGATHQIPQAWYGDGEEGQGSEHENTFKNGQIGSRDAFAGFPPAAGG